MPSSGRDRLVICGCRKCLQSEEICTQLNWHMAPSCKCQMRKDNKALCVSPVCNIMIHKYRSPGAVLLPDFILVLPLLALQLALGCGFFGGPGFAGPLTGS